MSIQLKRSLTSEISSDYILKQGQVGIEMQAAINSQSSPFRMKIGDGTTQWSSLPYFGESKDVDLSSVVPTSRKINNKALTADISLTANDVGAPTSSQLSALATRVTTLESSSSGGSTTSHDGLFDSQGYSHLAFEDQNWTVDKFVGNDNTLRYQTSWIYLNPYYGGNVFAGAGGFALLEPFTKAEIDWNSWLSGNENGMSFYPANYGKNGSGTNRTQMYLGYTNNRWTTVYCTTAINTSDRNSKHDIRYLDSAETVVLDDSSNPTSPLITLSDIIEFVSELQPVTYLYNECQYTKIEDVPDGHDQLFVQFGLVADDLINSKLWPYIGVTDHVEAKSDEYSPDGKLLHSGYPESTHHSLKLLALTSIALTTCKYLLQRVEMLESA